MTTSFRVGICGASGRSGHHALTELKDLPFFTLGAAVVSEKSAVRNTPATSEVNFQSLSKKIFTNTDGWIDFSTPEASLLLLKYCAEVKQPVVVATSGFSPEQREQIRLFGKDTPILFAPNTAIGIFTIREASRVAKEILGSSFDIEIVESHHKGKKDAPSGTALMLANSLSDSDSTLVVDRGARQGVRKSNEIGISSLRGGDVPAEHTIYFMGEGEQIELVHRTRNRSIFARGALHLLNILREKKPGYYELSRDFFGI